jgi:uncharacterized membrane protein YfcA
VVALLTLAGLGLVAGALSGLFGVGGGFVLVPLLVLAGWDLTHAVGTSLLYVVAMGLGGAVSHYRARNLDGGFVLRFLIPAVLGAQLGAQLAVLFPDAGLSIAFSVFLTALAYSMRQPDQEAPHDDARAPWGPVIGVGSVMGVLSGLFGVGGGVLFVPAQVKLFGVPIKRAVGNSMLLVLLVGLSGLAAHAWLGTVAWREGAALIAGGALGLRGGLLVLRRVSGASLQGYLVWLLAAMAVYMLIQGLLTWAG